MNIIYRIVIYKDDIIDNETYSRIYWDLDKAIEEAHELAYECDRVTIYEEHPAPEGFYSTKHQRRIK